MTASRPGTKILVWLLGIMAVGILLCVLFALLKIAVKAMVIVAGCARIVCNHRHSVAATTPKRK